MLLSFHLIGLLLPLQFDAEVQRPAPHHVVTAKSKKIGQVSQKRTWGCDYVKFMGERGLEGAGRPSHGFWAGSAFYLSDPSTWKPSFLPSERTSAPIPAVRWV